MAIEIKIVDSHFRIIQSGARVTKLKVIVSDRNSGNCNLVFSGNNLNYSVSSDFAKIDLVFKEEKELVIIDTKESLEQGMNIRYEFYPEFGDGEGKELFVPCVWYRDNLSGSGCFPNSSKSSFWSFDETRMSIPALIQVSNFNKHLIIAKRKADDFVRRSSSGWNSDKTIYIMRPSSEFPYSYQGKKLLKECDELKYTDSDKTVSQRLYCYNTSASEPLEAYERFVKLFDLMEPFPSFSVPDWHSYAESKLIRLLNLVAKDGYLLMGEGNGSEQDVYEFTSASFLVKSIEAASCFASTPKELIDSCCPELLNAICEASKRTGLINDNNFLINLSQLIGDFFLSFEDDGRFQDCLDLKTGENGGYLGIGEHPEFKYLINARCNGEALKAYLDLYDSLKKQGIEKAEYLEIAKRVAAFYLDIQLSNGSFGRWWSKAGKPENTMGTNGAYISVFLLRLQDFLEPDDELFERVNVGIRRSVSFYKQLIEEGLFYGDTLDADSCDKEAGVVLLDLMLTYFEKTGDGGVLEYAYKGARFVLSWIYQSDCVFKDGSPLLEKGFHAAGTSAVSVAHHHLDFYGMLIAYLFLRYERASGDKLYKEQALLMMKSSRQLIAKKSDTLGRDKYFTGWQPEQLNHTMWDYFNRNSNMNGTFSIDISWVNVLGYSSYLSILKDFSEELYET